MQNNQMDFLLYLKINSSIGHQIDQYWRLLSPERKARIKRIGTDQRASIIGSELLVRVLTCKFLNIRNSEIIFSKNSYGKPYIVGYPNFHFNISHSYTSIAVAVSSDPTGIDMEKIGHPNFKISQRFFLPQEQDYILSDCETANKRFYEIWTRKEAYIKYLGKGLSVPLSAFNVLEPHLARHFKTYEIDQYIISIFADKENPQYRLIELTEEEFLTDLSIL